MRRGVCPRRGSPGGFRPRRESRPLRKRSAPGCLNRQSPEAAALPGHRSIPLESSVDASGQGGPLLSRSSGAVPLPAPAHPDAEGQQPGPGRPTKERLPAGLVPERLRQTSSSHSSRPGRFPEKAAGMVPQLPPHSHCRSPRRLSGSALDSASQGAGGS